MLRSFLGTKDLGGTQASTSTRRARPHLTDKQGRVAGLAKAVEIIKANTDVKKAIEIIRLHSLAQQAQEGKGVGNEVVYVRYPFRACQYPQRMTRGHSPRLKNTTSR